MSIEERDAHRNEAGEDNETDDDDTPRLAGSGDEDDERAKAQEDEADEQGEEEGEPVDLSKLVRLMRRNVFAENAEADQDEAGKQNIEQAK